MEGASGDDCQDEEIDSGEHAKKRLGLPEEGGELWKGMGSRKRDGKGSSDIMGDGKTNMDAMKDR